MGREKCGRGKRKRMGTEREERKGEGERGRRPKCPDSIGESFLGKGSAAPVWIVQV